MGVDGVFFCIYQEDSLIAEALRPVTAHGVTGAATLFYTSPHTLEAAALLWLYYEARRLLRKKRRQRRLPTTKRKALLDRHDPLFCINS